MGEANIGDGSTGDGSTGDGSLSEPGHIEYTRLTDGEALRAGNGLQTVLRGMSRIARRLAAFAAVVGIATFATGMWVFEGSGRAKWVVVGGFLCFGPAVSAALAAFRVLRTAAQAPRFAGELKSLRQGGRALVDVLIDGDTGRPVGLTATTFSAVRSEIDQRRKEFPGLSTAMTAVTTVPRLLIWATLGTVVAGGLGTILLIGGLINRPAAARANRESRSAHRRTCGRVGRDEGTDRRLDPEFHLGAGRRLETQRRLHLQVADDAPEKLLGCDLRVVDGNGARVALELEECLHAGVRATGAEFEERAPEIGETRVLASSETQQHDGSFVEGAGRDRAPQAPQSVDKTHPCPVVATIGHHGGRGDLVDDRREQRLLRGEVAVQRRFRATRLGNQLVHRDAVEAMRGEHLQGGGQVGLTTTH